MGDYIIDDRTAGGVDNFVGEHIHFGTEKYPDWDAVMRYLGWCGAEEQVSDLVSDADEIPWNKVKQSVRNVL